MRVMSWQAMVAAVALAVSACSSSTDTAPTGSPTTGDTSTTTSSVTTSTVAAAFDIPIEIVSPRNASTLAAVIDRGDGSLAAAVRLSARVELPEGQTVTVAWASDIDGDLGDGSVLDVELSNDGNDVAGHQITATVTSSGGGRGTATVFVIVQVPSN